MYRTKIYYMDGLIETITWEDNVVREGIAQFQLDEDETQFITIPLHTIRKMTTEKLEDE